MGIKFKGYSIVSKDAGAEVSTTFDVGDLSEAEQLLTGCKSLGARGTVTQETRAPKPAKEKPAAAPPPPASDPDLEDDEELDDEEDEPEEVEDEPADEEDEEPEDEPKPPPKKGKAAAAPAPAAPPAGGSSKLKITPTMLKAERFKDPVLELFAQGFNTAAKLVKACTAVHDKVPAIKKVKVEELPARVQRVIDMEGLDVG